MCDDYSCPTHAPSALPTVSPTPLPSVAPSFPPSSSPSSQPSSQPSTQPSRQPSQQPDCVPTGQPSSQPTSRPSKTPAPTKKGATNRPSSSPTSTPTFNEFDYADSPIYGDLMTVENEFNKIYTDIHSFSSLHYKDSNPLGTCNDWNSYIRSDLALPFTYVYFSSINIAYEVFDYDTLISVNYTATCNEKVTISEIISALSDNNASHSFQGYCNANLWRVYSCPGTGGNVLCVNCDARCLPNKQPVCPGEINQERHTVVVNPCQPCFSHRAAFSVLGFTIQEDILYPQIILPMVIMPSQHSIIVLVNLTTHGTVYCAAYPSLSFSISSLTIAAIKNAGFSQNFLLLQANTGKAITQNLTSVEIFGLFPSSLYEIFCYTEDYSAHTMPLLEVIATQIPSNTTCCRAIHFTSTFQSIREYVPAGASPSGVDSIFAFALDSPPVVDVSIILSIAPILEHCNNLVNGVAPSISAYPSSFGFTPVSLSLSGGFILRGTPGCYEVTVELDPSSLSAAQHSEVLYFNATFIVNVQSVLAIPPYPKLSFAGFSSDGLSISVFLYSPTDLGATKIAGYLGVFDCSLLFDFPGASIGRCFWQSNMQVQATLNNGIINIGDSILLRSNVIKAVCPQQRTCDYAPSSSVNLGAPANALQPVVSISTPSVVGACADIVIDPTNSFGQCGRPWRNIIWSVAAAGSQNSTQVNSIVSLLNTNFLSTAVLAIIPNSVLSSGTYQFTLQLTNFLFKTAIFTTSVTVVSNSIVPQVSILGPALTNLFRWQPFSVFALASVPSCGGKKSQVVPLTYTWQVYKGLIFQQRIVSTSLDQRFFNLNPYILDSSSLYSVVVTVSVASGDPTIPTASDVISIQTGVSGVIAAVLGGSYRTASPSSDLILDAWGGGGQAASYSIDYPTDPSVLSFTWRCKTISPLFGDLCNVKLPNTDSITIPRDTFSLTESQTFQFTVFVQNSFGSIASASTTIAFISHAMPVVSIGGLQRKYNPNQNLVLTGSVTTISAANVNWGSSSIPLAGINLTALHIMVPLGQSYFQLSISANTLTPGASYLFQLTSTYSKSNPNLKDAAAQVTVLMNAPPYGGGLDVTPSTGAALNTTFFFNTHSWSDAPEDYPILFVLSTYTSSITTSSNLVKSSSQTPYANALLGQGIEVMGYNVTCLATATDFYGSFGTVSTVITVKPIQDISALTSVLSSSLSSAFSASDPVGVSQVINAVTSCLNIVNCTVPQVCSTIGREICTSTPNTCGSCLPTLLGPYGDSNVPCKTSDVLKRIGDACTDNSACITGLCVADTNLCADTDKLCPQACSANGVCLFTDNYGDIIPHCGQSNSNCQSACHCDNTFHGSDCSLSLSALNQAIHMRDALCVGINRLLNIQVVTVDVVQSRCTTISGVLMQMSEISAIALGNCTEALTKTIISYPNYAASNGNADVSNHALSLVLNSGASSLSAYILSQVSAALTALASGVQANLVVGQAPAVFVSSTMSTSNIMTSSASLAVQTFSPPQSAADKFNNAPLTSLSLNANSSHPLSSSTNAIIGVSIVQYRTRSTTQLKSSPLKLVATKYAVTNNAKKSRLLTPLARVHRVLSPTEIQLGVTITLQNFSPVHYYTLPGAVDVVTCMKTGFAYNMTLPCTMYTETMTPYFNNFSFSCPGDQQGFLNYTCPRTTLVPQCIVIGESSASFAANPLCSVSKYDAMSTTCECLAGFTSSPTAAGRRLNTEAVSSEEAAFSSSLSTVGSTFVSTWQVIGTLNGDTISKNQTIFSTILIVLVLLISGTLYLSRDDFEYIKKERVKHVALHHKNSHRRIIPNNIFFDKLIPIDFSGQAW